MAFQPNWRIDGEKYQYAIVRELGEGGFGITYLAKRSDGKQVVIKTLNDKMQNDREFNELQQKFIREAFLLRGLNHPHIVKVLDICQSVNLQCMVMEYVDGESLFDRVDRRGALSEDEALRYIKQIGSALDYMHDPKLHPDPMLHRDLNPYNIMLRRKPDEAVLIDFGLAREFTPDKTGTHTAHGFIGFCPIEQMDSRRKRGAYTDVYGLSAAFYYALTREFPPDVRDIKIRIARLVPPKQHNGDVSEAVSKAILWGMKLEPKDRPQTVQKWLERLDVAKPAESPKKFPYLLLAIGGGLYAISTFCLVFFHVLTWQLAKETAIAFLLPFMASSVVALWLKKNNKVFFASLLTGMAIGGSGGYLLGGANLAVGGAVGGTFLGALVGFGVVSLVGAGALVKAETGAFAGAGFLSFAFAWACVCAFAGVWTVALLSALNWAFVGALTLAKEKEWKWLENVATVCFFITFTPLGIPFFFAIGNMKRKSFSEQKMFSITIGTIFLGLIVGSGLGWLTLLLMGR